MKDQTISQVKPANFELSLEADASAMSLLALQPSFGNLPRATINRPEFNFEFRITAKEFARYYKSTILNMTTAIHKQLEGIDIRAQTDEEGDWEVELTSPRRWVIPDR